MATSELINNTGKGQSIKNCGMKNKSKEAGSVQDQHSFRAFKKRRNSGDCLSSKHVYSYPAEGRELQLILHLFFFFASKQAES